MISKNFPQLKVLEIGIKDVNHAKYLNYKDLQDLKFLKELIITIVVNYMSKFKQIIEAKFH